MKKLIYAAVIVLALAVIYSILPEYPKAGVTYFFQKTFDQEAQIAVSEVMTTTNPELNAIYLDICKNHANMPTWVYDKENDTVTYYGNGVEINLEEQQLGYYTSTKVKIVFAKDDISIYVNGNLVPDKFESIVLNQMYNGL